MLFLNIKLIIVFTWSDPPVIVLSKAWLIVFHILIAICLAKNLPKAAS